MLHKCNFISNLYVAKYFSYVAFYWLFYYLLASFKPSKSYLVVFMSDLGERIKVRRKELSMSQSELADKVGISYAQVGRYETKDVQPPAKTLTAIADALGVSPDFLIYGDSGEKAKNRLSDPELINQFKAIELMDEDDRNVVKKLIDAFITKKQIQKLAQ